MNPFLSFFVILFVAVVFSQLFSRMKIPWVVALIIGGIVIGPSGLELFEMDATIEFFATIGLVFLMFMAGLESRTSGAKDIKWKIVWATLFIGIFPAVIGLVIALAFGYSWPTSILLGIIFISSAIALMIPQFQAQKIIGSDLGRVILGSAVAVDAASLILLSVFLQLALGSFSYLTILMYAGLTALVLGALWFVPKIRWLAFSEDYPEKQDLFEKELRFIILVLIGFVVLFELVGLHVIVAAFFAGLVLSKSLKSRITRVKLHAISYGFFVPVFFVTVGVNTDISVFMGSSSMGAIFLAVSIILGLIVSKFLGGFAAGRLIGFNKQESIFLGSVIIPQLSTALAVAFLGFGAGLLDADLLASIVALSIVTATIAPIIASILGNRLTSQQITIPEAKPEVEPKEESMENK